MWKPTQPDQLIHDHINRVSLKDLASRYHGTVDQIRGFLNRTDNWTPYKTGKVNLPIDDIIAAYKQDVDIAEIAKSYGVSTGPIVQLLTSRGIRKPMWLKHLPFSRIDQLLDREYFSSNVNEHIGLHPLMEALGVGETLVRRLCEHHDISLSSNSGLVRSMRNRKQATVEMTKGSFERHHFEYNESLSTIAAGMCVSVGYLRQLVSSWGITLQDTRVSPEFRQFKDLDSCEMQQLVNDTPVTLLCKQLNVCFDTLRNELTTRDINVPARYRSSGEQQIESIIRQAYDGTVHVCKRDIIYPYELDIVIPDKALAIEYCGLYWHSELQGKDRKYHLNKLELCAAKGYTLITIFEDEYLSNPDLVARKLLNLIGCGEITRTINARSCEVVEIGSKEKQVFLDQNHIQGNDKSSIKLGLKYEGEIVSVMTFAKPSRSRSSVAMMQSVDLWELNRFASDIRCRVRGAAGKLLKYFQRNYEWSQIYSYADKRWSIGNLYSVLGFEHTHDAPPNYWYASRGYNKREYRYNYTKFSLVELGYDPDKSERQIMMDRGYTRVWDCGSMKFVMVNSDYKKPA